MLRTVEQEHRVQQFAAPSPILHISAMLLVNNFRFEGKQTVYLTTLN